MNLRINNAEGVGHFQPGDLDNTLSCAYSQVRVVFGPMGTKARYRPKNLARKLRQIRKALGLSQSEMLRCLGAEKSFSAARISEYESGIREPALWVLLAYGRVAGIHLESLVDDEAVLPDKLPGSFKFRRLHQKLAVDPSEK